MCGVFFLLEIKQVIVAGSVGTMFFWVHIIVLTNAVCVVGVVIFVNSGFEAYG